MIPTADDLRSATMIHKPGDLFNPPALTNFMGCVQAAVDPVALCNLNFPPVACGEVASGHLFLDGRIFASTGQPVSFTWYPDRIDRQASGNGWKVTSTTVMAWGATAAVTRIVVHNQSGSIRSLRAGLVLQGSVARSLEGWRQPSAPTEGANAVEVDAARRALVFTAPSGAASIQGLVAESGTPDERGIWFDVDLSPGGFWQGYYLHAVGDDLTTARTVFDEVAADPGAEIHKARREWDAELAAVFTPGNRRYSGSLPELETDDPSLLRLYYQGVLGVVYFKRDSPHSVVGRTYDTLMPRYWQTTTYLWDYSLSSTVHALLDPIAMRDHLGRWMTHDVHACYGTEWLTGRPVGMWYSVNDYAMTHMIDEYLSWSGTGEWLDETVTAPGGEPATVGEMLSSYAGNWRRYASETGLADYGGIGNLLECVSSYVHEVASLNAANVWNLRTAARYAKDAKAASRLRAEADELVERLWSLYQEGEGWFNARQPGGALLPVRHCYDLLMVLATIRDDISQARRDEMVRFFQTQLQTDSWMRALSPEDPDAVTSLRPDHQWNGAYTAWPAEVAAGLFNIGRDDVAADWIRGLANSGNQGPFAQAHFTEDFIPGVESGSRKASFEQPYINDWACSSGGSWAKLVIRSIFGVDPTRDRLDARPRLDRLDGDARLLNLAHRGNLFTVDRNGAHPV